MAAGGASWRQLRAGGGGLTYTTGGEGGGGLGHDDGTEGGHSGDDRGDELHFGGLVTIRASRRGLRRQLCVGCRCVAVMLYREEVSAL